MTVDDQVLVVTDLYLLTTQGHQSFDIELICRHTRMLDVSGLENDDFPTCRSSEIVAQTVDEQMVACFHLHVDDFIALLELLPVLQSCTARKVVGWKPYLVIHAPKQETLICDEREDSSDGLDAIELTIRGSFQLDMADARKEISHPASKR